MEVGDALESAEKAEAWLLEWWQLVIGALDLPPKFYVSGHSAGGAQLMIYASAFPERIEGMFLQSPAAAEDHTREGYVYDPYTIRKKDDTAAVPSKKEVDHAIWMFDNNVHIFTDLRKVPYCAFRLIFKHHLRQELSPLIWSDEHLTACATYYAIMIQRWGMQDVVF